MKQPNFRNLDTGEEIYLERYTFKVIDGDIVYFDKNKKRLNIEKIEPRTVIATSIKTPTKNRI